MRSNFFITKIAKLFFFFFFFEFSFNFRRETVYFELVGRRSDIWPVWRAFKKIKKKVKTDNLKYTYFLRNFRGS